jgi:hemerythrin-like domain-containing protein
MLNHLKENKYRNQDSNRRLSMDGKIQHRRQFIGTGLKVALAAGIGGPALLTGCTKKGEEKEVSPPEDLMQEHGVLNRILLIYDKCRTNLTTNVDFPIDSLLKAAGLLRTFIEDYHEKHEEKYLFPRFQKANQLTNLVDVLLKQHEAGRNITDQLMELSKIKNRSDSEQQQIVKLLESFNTMYRPHEAREDTVLFPAFRKLVSQNEYDSLGEEFEKKEHELFGQDGFENVVHRIEIIEKSLGILDLDQFTPIIK